MNGKFLLLSILAVVTFAILGHGADPKPVSRTKDEILRLFADEFVMLTPGSDKHPASFLMGAEANSPDNRQPVHKVTFRQPFAVAKYEVTQELYEAVMGTNPSRWKGPRNSVEMVSWTDANDFCRKVTAELRQQKLLPEGDVIRLPSEAEWEYACRAGTTTNFSFGNDPKDLKDYAWYKDNSKGNDPPVGKKKPSPWGLYDMHGYVWEWCADRWHTGYGGALADATVWEAGDHPARVLRGGSWANQAGNCESAFRHAQKPDHQSDTIGFRCVRAMEQK